MNKIIHITAVLLIAFSGLLSAQSTPSRVAVIFNTDTTFTLMGTINVRTFNVNITNDIYKSFKSITDSKSFEMVRVNMPEDLLTLQGEKYSGLPQMRDLSHWMKTLKKDSKFDYALFFFKPVRLNPPFEHFNTFSYGMSVSSYKVFSAFDVVVYDLKTMNPVAYSTCKDPADFIAGDVVKPDVPKYLDQYSADDIKLPLSVISVLNQELVIKAYQCLQLAKKTATKK